MAVSMEVMLELWSLTLRDGKERLRPLFKHVSVADSAASYIDGLFGPERRKTGWMRAEAAGDAGPFSIRPALVKHFRLVFLLGVMRSRARASLLYSAGVGQALQTGFPPWRDALAGPRFSSR
jgi:hypothetical protein